ncbi:exodeoxyribonuclease VII large subunit [Prosthecochloris sp. GSB1]|uniref:exodeoxyribonuclease VII large subunit n=1 Tax=Prosthecochloris sp. GSB1 TaxID=281093 RepID=UPI000B8CB34E|nr:exodeoxyribonuclease VII large subunit [Prosthecochloris sp. GSB1]ASQ91765.1 exodeoxyribonuclease VII large subunit [Prosthecochloris sp. GSB1]
MQENILSVGELTRELKALVESSYPSVSVRGEISNYKLHGSGHVYMTLKDEDAQIPAVIWKSHRRNSSSELRDGLQVVARGRLEVYPPSGRYQLICTSVVASGEGALQLAFAELLRKLAAKGYFSPEHKKPLPAVPRCIGLVTSPTGAVIQDMKNVFERRFPAARLLLFPVKVQGEGAAASVIEAISYFNAPTDPDLTPDVIIVARGGGSLEDLQAFNEESVAMAIFNSSIPVISAVGHETDVTIADMVADARAGTPSIAAELAVPDSAELLRAAETMTKRQGIAVSTKIEGAERHLHSLLGSYAFNKPVVALERLDELAGFLVKQMSGALGNSTRHTEQRFASAFQRLSLLDYKKTLERGFALVRKNGMFVTSVSGLAAGEEASVLFRDGEVKVEVIEHRDGCGTGAVQAPGPAAY